MMTRCFLQRLLAPGAAALALAAAPLAARADVSVEAGALFSRTTYFAGGASVGLFNTPVAPIAGELSFMTGNGSAGTLDLRTRGSTAVGLGIGVGNINATNVTTVVYDGILAHTIAPHTALEGRIYFGPLRTSSVFAGLRLSF
jgi:hypothetical protein